jgi:hypothetical protein
MLKETLLAGILLLLLGCSMVADSVGPALPESSDSTVVYVRTVNDERMMFDGVRHQLIVAGVTMVGTALWFNDSSDLRVSYSATQVGDRWTEEYYEHRYSSSFCGDTMKLIDEDLIETFWVKKQ